MIFFLGTRDCTNDHSTGESFSLSSKLGRFSAFMGTRLSTVLFRHMLCTSQPEEKCTSSKRLRVHMSVRRCKLSGLSFPILLLTFCFYQHGRSPQSPSLSPCHFLVSMGAARALVGSPPHHEPLCDAEEGKTKVNVSTSNQRALLIGISYPDSTSPLWTP